MSGSWRTRFCLRCGHVDAADEFAFVGPVGAYWNDDEAEQAQRQCPNCGHRSETRDFPTHSDKAYMVAFGPGCATCDARPVGVAADGGPAYPATCLHEPIFVTAPKQRSVPDEDHQHGYGRTTEGGWQCVGCGTTPDVGAANAERSVA